MKKPIFHLLALAAILNFSLPGSLTAQTTNNATLTVYISFANIEAGYDHDNKTEIYIDGKLAATSTVTKESVKNSVSAKTSKGNHDIRIVNYAYYEGVWEEHTIANNYSQDFIYNASMNLTKKKTKLKLLFDVDNGMQVK